MLDLIPHTQEGASNRNTMDLSQYLLSASPPSLRFDFMAVSIQQTSNVHHNNNNNNNNNNNSQLHQTNAVGFNDNDTFQFSSTDINVNSMTCPFHHSSFPRNLDNNSFKFNTQKSSSTLKSIIVCSENYCSDSDGESCSSSDSRSQSPRRGTKRVSFADHKGLALAQVRLVKEGPDEPPQLNSKVLSMITQGAIAGVTSNPPIKLCFPQPASDYMAFRDKVRSNLVSLENVILQDYTVKGTIKVKNITFQKEVFIRVSLDEWSSFEDHEATYVPGPGNGFVDANDTFSFQLDISPSFDVAKKIQFAVCFKENDKEHWDNNDGVNYCIVSDNFQSAEQPSCLISDRWLPEKDSDSSWTEFSVWRDPGCYGRYY